MAKSAKKKRADEKLLGTHPGDKVICKNRRASRNYELGETFEAGLVLKGSEVKSCREGGAHLNDAYVRMDHGEAWLISSHIGEYSHGGPHLNHEPQRARKLLLHRNELHKLDKKISERGFVAIPLALYFKNGNVKVQFAVGKGKTHGDKRHAVQERDTQREMQRAMRRGRR